MSIHPTAIIDPGVELGADVEIGPYAIVGPHCAIGGGARIDSHAVLKEFVTLGENVRVASGAVLGGEPQDLGFKGERSRVVVGNNAVIRECATINRASGEGNETVVGDGCLIMAYSHLGHNVRLGREVILANNVQLAGYVEVGDYAFIGGTCVFHQFVRIGKLAIISGFSASRQDIAPFSMCDGRPAIAAGINKVGLRRRGYDLNARTVLKKAFQRLFFSEMNTRQALDAIEAEWGDQPYIQELVEFVRTSRRGLCKAPRFARSAGDAAENASPGGMFGDVPLEVF
jgi:UDP-N-acetylglucosamine acyltransferase